MSEYKRILDWDELRDLLETEEPPKTWQEHEHEQEREDEGNGI